MVGCRVGHDTTDPAWFYLVSVERQRRHLHGQLDIVQQSNLKSKFELRTELNLSQSYALVTVLILPPVHTQYHQRQPGQAVNHEQY